MSPTCDPTRRYADAGKRPKIKVVASLPAPAALRAHFESVLNSFDSTLALGLLQTAQGTSCTDMFGVRATTASGLTVPAACRGGVALTRCVYRFVRSAGQSVMYHASPCLVRTTLRVPDAQ